MNLTKRRLARRPEIRSAGGPDVPGDRLCGYAAVFHLESEILYDVDVIKDRQGNPLPFVEVLAPTVFDRTLAQMPDVRALYNHETGSVLGRTKSGTLRLSIDEVGLLFDDDLPDTVDGQRARELVARGDIDGCSFGFQVREHSLEARKGLPHLRTLYDVDLYEISIAVTFPAYSQTAVSVRNLDRGTTPKPTSRLALARLALLAEGF